MRPEAFVPSTTKTMTHSLYPSSMLSSQEHYYYGYNYNRPVQHQAQILPSLASVLQAVGLSPSSPSPSPPLVQPFYHTPQQYMSPPPIYSSHQVSISHSPPHIILDRSPVSPQETSIIAPAKLKPMKPRKSNKKARILPTEASAILNEWFEKNKHNPYPTNEEKEYFLRVTGLTRKQVKDWFVNHRSRLPSNLKNRAAAKSVEKVPTITSDKNMIKKSQKTRAFLYSLT